MPADVGIGGAVGWVLDVEDGFGDVCGSDVVGESGGEIGLKDFDAAGVSEIFSFGGELVEGEFAGGVGRDDDFGFGVGRRRRRLGLGLGLRLCESRREGWKDHQESDSE